ncbi:SDR family NAD(P)-dependent oxidoreductase [Sphingobium sp. V4]|uniref:SDR family NAD(P)-dependent oxidoreductase n=1 Tax=Sphingobium sp. V4 TaxID=3038927 RepID=UPI002557EB9E|nr:SDR family NAD(P)-dependent oxidoreductase [Sphingobium sp. V4]WIW89501.1 SDR family NAD(P)-dependent oxidoreductase [Sphingobium sp. V4]
MSVVLVTGCSSGFGQAIALGFASRGDTVIATMRRPEQARAELTGFGPNLIVEPLDVADARSREAIIELVLARFGQLDVLVNNAGVSGTAPLEELPEDVHRSIFETNYFGPVALMQLALPVMRTQRAGRMITVSSVASVSTPALRGAYSASKHAIDAAAAVFDIEGRAFGIRAPTVLPGFFVTAIRDNALIKQVSAAYAAIEAGFAANSGHAAAAETDLTSVVNAVLAAALDPDPPQRIVVGRGFAEKIEPIVLAMNANHAWELQRSGIDV